MIWSEHRATPTRRAGRPTDAAAQQKNFNSKHIRVEYIRVCALLLRVPLLEDLLLGHVATPYLQAHSARLAEGQHVA